jgi:hypothetical protein
MDRGPKENFQVGDVGESNRMNARARYQTMHKNVDPELQDRSPEVCPNNI